MPSAILSLYREIKAPNNNKIHNNPQNLSQFNNKTSKRRMKLANKKSPRKLKMKKNRTRSRKNSAKNSKKRNN